MGVLEAHGCSLTGLDYDLTGGGVVIPQRILAGLVNLPDIVGTGSDPDGDDTVGIRCKRRPGNEFGTGSIRVDIELPAFKVCTRVGGLDDVGISRLVVREGHGLGSACCHGQGSDCGIKVPVRKSVGLIYLLDIVGTGRKILYDFTGGIRCEGRAGHLLGQGGVGIDVELPAAQIGAGVGLLDDLAVAILGVGDSDGCGAVALHLHGLDTVIRDPVVDTGAGFLDIVGSRLQTGDGDLTGCGSREGRAGNGFGTGRVRIHSEHPSAQALPGVRRFLDHQTAGDLLVDCVDRNDIVRGVLRQGHSPFRRAAGLIARGEHRLGHHIGTQGQLAGLGIAVDIGGADVIGIPCRLIHGLELGPGQLSAIGILFVDLNEAGLIHGIVDLQMVPGHGSRGLGAGVGHVLHGTDLRTTGITHMDDEVVLAPVGAAGGIHVVGTGVNGDMHIGAIPLEYDHVTGHQILICLAGTGILGNAGSCLGSQGIQGCPPGGNRSQIVCIAFCTNFLDLVINGAGINSFNVRKIVAQVVGDERSANHAVALEVADLGSPARYGAGVSNGFVTIGTGSAAVVANVRQDRGGVGLQAGGDVVGDIEVSLILQPLDIIAGVFQGPEDRIVIHLLRDFGHIRHRCHGVGIILQNPAGIEVVYGDTVGVRVVRVQRINTLDGFGQLGRQLRPAKRIVRNGAIARRRFGDRLGPNIRGRKDRRHEAQHQNKYQQKRKQLLMVRFHT